MRARSLAVRMICVLALLSVSVASDAPAHPELLVSTQWLADHLHDADLVIVAIARREDDYRKGHIPGARYLALTSIANVADHPGTELLPPEQIRHNLEAIGISDHSRIVIYTTDYDPIASRLFFTLDYIGQGSHAALLDGGIEVWKRENRPTTTDAPSVTPGKLSVHLHPEVVAKMDWVSKAVAGSEPAALLDARPMNRYTAGHLPGAMPMYWQTTQVDHLLKPPAELQQMFAAAGVAAGKKMVSYCEVGQQATYVYFLARYLGLDAAMYDGSYMEWSTENQPVVKGEAPK